MIKKNESGLIAKEHAFQMGDIADSSPVSESELEQEEDQEEEKETLPLDPIEALKFMVGKLVLSYPDIPEFETLFKWKQMHKNLFFLPLGDKMIIYRYMKRQEWIQMQIKMSQENSDLQKLTKVQLEEYIFDKCVLWPQFSLIEKANLEAGFISTVHDQIQLHSMFLDPNALAQITIKL
jgi:hypothetical protein